MSIWKSAAIFILFCPLISAQAPERTARGNTLHSERDPGLTIRLPKDVQYAGADRWLLYDIADCELHAFVLADSKKNVQQIYWVQFEQYVPTRPDLHHTYDSPHHAQLGGKDFYVDTWVRVRDAETTPGSDRQHIETMIRAREYRLPNGMMYVRLVHLLDEQKRKELMIIYGEDLAPSGFTAPELEKGGAHFDRWAAISDGLVERAQRQIALEFGQ
jgi:hypothetical protein